MTKEQRKAEFDRLFESIPGRNIDRIRAVCGILFCKPNTVRVWRVKTGLNRVIPADKLQILQRELNKTATF